LSPNELFSYLKRENQSSGQYCNPDIPVGQEFLFWNSDFIHDRPSCVCRHIQWESICNFPIQTLVEYMRKRSFGNTEEAQILHIYAEFEQINYFFNKRMCWEALILTKAVTSYRVVQLLVQKGMHRLNNVHF